MNTQGSNEQLVALSSLLIGQKALIVAFSFDTKEGEQIQEMGLTQGEKLEVVRISPLEDHVEINIRGYFIALRKQDADRIMVKQYA